MEKQLKEIINTIEQLPNDNQRRKYLRTIGRVRSGCNRMTVIVGDKVLKVAYGIYGVEQNTYEIKTFLKLKKYHKPFFATIYKYDKENYLWIVQEKLKIYREYNKRINLFDKKVENDLEYILEYYNLPYIETRHQVGLNKNGKIKIYDYGAEAC